MGEKEKMYKSENRGLTFPIPFGILTKLCDSGEAGELLKKTSREGKENS